MSTHFHAANLKELTLQPVDAIITSPPYPGVYDYLSTADVAIALGLRLGEEQRGHKLKWVSLEFCD